VRQGPPATCQDALAVLTPRRDPHPHPEGPELGAGAVAVGHGVSIGHPVRADTGRGWMKERRPGCRRAPQPPPRGGKRSALTGRGYVSGRCGTGPRPSRDVVVTPPGVHGRHVQCARVSRPPLGSAPRAVRTASPKDAAEQVAKTSSPRRVTSGRCSPAAAPCRRHHEPPRFAPRGPSLGTGRTPFACPSRPGRVGGGDLLKRSSAPGLGVGVYCLGQLADRRA